MSTLAIQVDGIGKQYQLGLREKSHQTFREAVVDLAAAPLRRLKRLSGRSNGDDIFWALKDISFDVPEGEVLGIIGHNGAGKSTLLKILSRITEPTEGRATIHGRVASLLEVGTGFHQELTGRENVYLNGAILGMSRAEIDRKFDEIVDFAGVEQFLDTPIKRYSSGMKVRLAFAVAAHLEPEVLIIDEVLAVGDIEFQKRCLTKMNDVASSGRTLLFVSHNMAAVSALCNNCILLSRGRLVKSGPTDQCISQYLGSITKLDQQEWNGSYGDETVLLTKTWVRTLSEDGEYHTAAPIEVGVEVDVLCPFEGLIVGFRIYSEFGYPLAYLLFDDQEVTPPERMRPGRHAATFCIPANTLAVGRYRIGFEVGQAWTKAVVLDSPGELSFEVQNYSGNGRRYPVSRKDGFTSLFRPAWQHQVE